MAEDVLQRSIRMVRGKTSKGMINLNTNASRPKVIARLFDAGLDSIRVSLNSAQIDYYTRYFKPRDYTFVDVMQSIKIAKKKTMFCTYTKRQIVKKGKSKIIIHLCLSCKKVRRLNSDSHNPESWITFETFNQENPYLKIIDDTCPECSSNP